MSVQCLGTTKKKIQCNRRVRKGSYCYDHKHQEPVVISLLDEEKDAEKVIPFVYKEDQKKIECNICLEEHAVDNVEKLDCCHQEICNSCIFKLAKPVCPYCRGDITNKTKGKYYAPDLTPREESIMDYLHQYPMVDISPNEFFILMGIV